MISYVVVWEQEPYNTPRTKEIQAPNDDVAVAMTDSMMALKCGVHDIKLFRQIGYPLL